MLLIRKALILHGPAYIYTIQDYGLARTSISSQEDLCLAVFSTDFEVVSQNLKVHVASGCIASARRV